MIVFFVITYIGCIIVNQTYWFREKNYEKNEDDETNEFEFNKLKTKFVKMKELNKLKTKHKKLNK